MAIENMRPVCSVFNSIDKKEGKIEQGKVRSGSNKLKRQFPITNKTKEVCLNDSVSLLNSLLPLTTSL